MSLIPQPHSVTLHDGHVELPSLEHVVAEVDPSLPSEGYTLDVSTASGVHIKGGSEVGIFYGKQTLRQLLPASALRKAGASTKGPWKLQAQRISDAPSSGLRWRGCMLDVARHFMPVPDVLRFIELLTFHKLNILHFHLTDDQGWRIDIPAWPRLTTVGAYRARSMQGSRQHQIYDARPHGGFYSANDLREIVAFAAERHITVIPEVNMPGHMQAAIASYPELGNTDVEGRDQHVLVRDSWGISKQVLNVSDSTLDFCRSVLDFVCDIFPSKTIGIGGDEVPYDEWKNSPAAQSRMKQLGLATESALQGWFMEQMAVHLANRGRHAYAWDEIMAGYTGPVDSVQIAAWRGPGPTAIAAQRGFDVVTCPDVNAYLDYRQSDEPGEPTPVGTLLTLKDIYTFHPVPETLKPEEAAHVVGAQVNVWTEHMESARRVEYMVFPRLCAFAEVVWGSGGGSDGFDGFCKRLEDQHFGRLEALGVNYRPHTGPRPWDGRPDAPGKPESRAERLAHIDEITADLHRKQA
ncbi:sugar hydrolase [Pochonia chlamydosporia 170]|uniref:beta-N-acetylhexosaminidase n=1 Tax=Pochonia chlamydosporia 170 TaxID=1380566 RepID=A0A179FS69_METCM|nr:sugar hydrolase [Pochonia chlamydosporia 170]OAQ68486.1 sugar hydrolase [Pochonia chlamydosporia 170]